MATPARTRRDTRTRDARAERPPSVGEHGGARILEEGIAQRASDSSPMDLDDTAEQLQVRTPLSRRNGTRRSFTSCSARA